MVALDGDGAAGGLRACDTAAGRSRHLNILVNDDAVVDCIDEAGVFGLLTRGIEAGSKF